MTQPPLANQTKLIPPRLRPQFVARDRVTEKLKQSLDYPLTVVKADAGYGKSTALAAFLTETAIPCAWYTISEPDTDPLLFLLSLVQSFRRTFPGCGEHSLLLLYREGGERQLWAEAIDSLANDLLHVLQEETLLVLDDYHLVDCPDINSITDRLIERMPPRLHVILATRATPGLPSRVLWRVHGEVLEVGQADLAFTPGEVARLFEERYCYPLSDLQASALAAEMEGWIIALQLVAQQLQSLPGQSLGQVLKRLPGSFQLLFDYLAAEVLAKQPPQVQTFLLKTAVLRRLEPGLCTQLLECGEEQAADILRYLDEHSLFVLALEDGTYRYHHLFRDFLLKHGETGVTAGGDLHAKAAAAYRARGEHEEAVYHLLSAGESERAAELLSEIGSGMIGAGRWETLADWIDRLPQAQVRLYPQLLLFRGEAYRLSSRFEEALTCYRDARHLAAERGDMAAEIRALQGQVMVYLDTVQPALARPLLAEARHLVRGDRQARYTLLALTAENLTNEGKLRQALRLSSALMERERQPVPARIGQNRSGAHSGPDPRTLTRLGRLVDARGIVEQDLSSNMGVPQQRRAPRSHRESAVLLSWICALLGEAHVARASAEQGLRLAGELRAPIVEVASLARLGHAYLIGPDFDLERATQLYARSLRLSEQIGVRRFRAEALLGLVVAAGMRGQLAEGEEHAREAIGILEASGDTYLTAILWLGLGGAAVMSEDARAVQWLSQARDLSRRCGDDYGVCVSDIWRAMWHLQQREWPLFESAMGAALEMAERNSYGFLFTRPTFFGPKQLGESAALLAAANRHSVSASYTAELLQALAAQLPALAPAIPVWSPFQPDRHASHPATLHVQTLGYFRVWRGDQEIPKSAWSRDKAAQLFQILLSRRGRPMHREQLTELLWPDGKASPSALRVTLNALREALEPGHEPQAESPFVRRQGESILLHPEATIRVDADEFERLIREAQRLERVEGRNPAQALSIYRRALALYGGDFLPDALYAGWASERREYLAGLYLTTASRVAELLCDQGLYADAIQLCHEILSRDACWEEAYYVLMLCYSEQGNRSLALRSYKRCARHLHSELGVEPAPRTQALFKALSNLA